MQNALQATEETALVPKEVFGVEIADGPKVAAIFKGVMAQKPKKILFNGKEYAEFPDWQVISDYFGLTVKTHGAEAVEVHGVKGFRAIADLVNKDGISVGGAEAYCMTDEPNWARKPLFQLASMAQTRAASKAISNRYRWVVAMAGYGTTPAEEMATEERPAQTYQALPSRSTPKGEQTTIQPMLVDERTSKKGNKYWNVQDTEGVRYFTYSQKVVDQLLAAKATDSQCVVYVISDGKSTQLVEA